MISWQSLYKKELFKIDTNQPSKLVSKYISSIPKNSKVLDLGCGNGRNSFYLAENGYAVDAVDIADFDWAHKIEPELKNKITFKKLDIKEQFNIRDSYGAVLLIRLIQYLPPKIVESLFKEMADHLSDSGLIIGSYNTWRLNTKNHYLKKVGAEVYSHEPLFIKELAGLHGLKIIEFEVFKTVSQHVNYHSDIEVCEFVFKKS